MAQMEQQHLQVVEGRARPADLLRLRRHWQTTRRLSLALLLAWFSISFCAVFFARELSNLELFGWPFPFYLAAHGSVLLYVVIVAVYALCMRKADRQAESGF